VYAYVCQQTALQFLKDRHLDRCFHNKRIGQNA